MDCPYFSVLEYGVFDSVVKFPKMHITNDRLVDCYELEFYAADTDAKTYLNDRWFPLLQGTFLCAKPGNIRKSILPFKCYYIHLATEDPLLCSLLDRLPSLFLLPQSRELLLLWQQLVPLEPETHPEDRLMLESCILRIIHQVCRHTAREIRADRVFLHQRDLLRVEEFIRSHLAEELRLEALAKLCNLSPTYFHNVFTEYFGQTPARFILECRIAAAKTGLLTGEYSLAELAADCGFSSQSYFCYKFKQITGETPLQYRKKNLGKMEL